MPSLPLITVGLSAYNAENTIGAAITSVITQTYDNWELLLIDDGSTDSTVNIAMKFDDSRITIISDGHNKGLSKRLNQAVSLAKGKYFCRMDADDIAFLDRFEKQVAFLEANQTVDLVASSVLVFRDDGSIDGVIEVKESHEDICKNPWRGFYFPHPTWMGKLSWFKRHSYLSVADGVEDQLLLYSTFHNSHFAGINDVLLGYREDSRSFKKMFKRRVIFWRELSLTAIRYGNFKDFFMICLIQPLKIVGDFINLKLRIKSARNRMSKINPLIENKWHLLQLYLNKAPK
jgi:glycosyltransferase involved in cell wall biosynthesis